LIDEFVFFDTVGSPLGIERELFLFTASFLGSWNGYEVLADTALFNDFIFPVRSNSNSYEEIPRFL